MKPTANPFKRFMRLFFIFFFFFGMTLASFNVIVDPFLVFQMPRVKGFNEVKEELSRQNRLYKAMEIARQKPKVLILGSSRVMAGMNPEDLKYHLNEKAYNGSFSDASFEEIYHYFEHALYHQPDMQEMFLGLDLWGFNQHRKPHSDFSLNRLKSNAITWRDASCLLFSLDGLRSSLKTIENNFSRKALPYFTSLGQGEVIQFTTDRNFFKGASMAIPYIEYMFSHSDCYLDYSLDVKKVKLFQKLVQTCKEKNIKLHVFINPSHAFYWAAIDRGGLWDQLETWKYELSEIYPIWDFSGFNPITTQPIDERGNYYFDCSHYKPEIGKKIFAKILKSPQSLKEFGYLLTPETRERIFIKMRAERDKWLTCYPEIVKEIDRTLSKPEPKLFTKAETK